MTSLSLPSLGSDYGDQRLALYCLPFVSDILRVATSINTINILKERTLTEDEKMQTRLDISKWVIGAIPAAILAIASPFTGLITSIVSVAALIFTCAEQLKICFPSPLHASGCSAI